MAKIKLTKNEQKAQKDALKMYQRYLPTLTLKKQQLQSEIRTIEQKANEVRAQRVALEQEFKVWISVFGEEEAFKPGMVTVRNIKKGVGNIAGVTIPVYEGAEFGRGDYDLY
jgi:V/A-type H+-transporting ATPase subunit D